MKLAIAVLCVLGAAWPASAQPRDRLEIEHGPGFTMNARLVETPARGPFVQGSLCRRAFATPPPRYVRLQRFGADGAALDERIMRVRGMPGYRGGCGFFSFKAAPLGEGQRARLGALRWRGDASTRTAN